MAKETIKVEISFDEIIDQIEYYFNQVVETIPDTIKNVQDKYNKKVKKGLTKIAREAVMDFYHDYDKDRRAYFHGQEDLLNAFKVVVEDDNWDVYYDYTFMKHKHHQSNEIIYNNAFVEGYHGGSGGTDRWGITKDLPYYRTPMKIWTFWWNKPAKKSDEAPINVIKEASEIYMDEQIEKADREVFNTYKNEFAQMRKLLDMLKSI